MNHKSDFIIDIENCLMHEALKHAPEGTEPEALIHQWIQGIYSAAKTDFFPSGKLDKTMFLSKIKKAGIIIDIKELRGKIISETNIVQNMKHSFTFIDLFAGIGGMRIGFQNAGGFCTFSSEFEPKAQGTYYNNYTEEPFGDITKIKPTDIPDHDILVAGFPCQPFSNAGLKLGIEDTRGTLFYYIARILKEKKPKAALLENVKGLIGHDKGYTFKLIMETLTDMGYNCIINKSNIKEMNGEQLKRFGKEMVLNAKDFGVPQNRQRIYIVLWRDDIDCDFIYPVSENIKTRVGSILEKNPTRKYTISDKLWNGHKRRKEEHRKKGNGFGYSIVNRNSPYTSTISARYYKDGSEILIEQKNKNPRKVTPREAARLQGFPENFLINNSDNQAYKQFGNSVAIPVIEKIAVAIRDQILKEKVSVIK